MSDYYCPNCGADLENQYGFNPDAGYWTCTECGTLLTDPDDFNGTERFDGVGWFCDRCGAFLNKQPGFSDWNSTWTCTNCGCLNFISESEIRNTDEESSEEDDSIGWSEDSDESEDDSEEDDEDDYDDSWLTYSDSDNSGEQEPIQWFEKLKREKEEKKLREEYRKKREEAERYLRKKEKEAKEKEEKEQLRKEQRQRIWNTITRKKQVIGISSDQCIGRPYQDIVTILEKNNFAKIDVVEDDDLEIKDRSKEGTIKSIRVNRETEFDSERSFTFDSRIRIVYHTLKKTVSPLGFSDARKMDYVDVIWFFKEAGFASVETVPVPDLITGWFVRDGAIDYVSVDGRTNFRKKDVFRIDAPVVIYYHTFKSKK